MHGLSGACGRKRLRPVWRDVETADVILRLHDDARRRCKVGWITTRYELNPDVRLSARVRQIRDPLAIGGDGGREFIRGSRHKRHDAIEHGDCHGRGQKARKGDDPNQCGAHTGRRRKALRSSVDRRATLISFEVTKSVAATGPSTSFSAAHASPMSRRRSFGSFSTQ